MGGKRRTICCCGSIIWVQLIGWTQTIGFLLLSFTLFQLIEELPDDIKIHHDPYLKIIYDILVACTVILFTGILFGGFLLIGIYMKKTGFISAWIVYTILLLFFDIICTARVIILAISAPWLSIILAVLSVTLLLIIHGFSIFVVNIHVSEMYLPSPLPSRLV